MIKRLCCLFFGHKLYSYNCSDWKVHGDYLEREGVCDRCGVRLLDRQPLHWPTYGAVHQYYRSLQTEGKDKK